MSKKIRAVAFQEGDVWVVQGVDYDIVAQTNDPLDATTAFLNAVIETVTINASLGRKGLEEIEAAPDRFQKMFDEAKKALRDLEEPAPMAHIPPPQLDLRLYQRAA